MLTLGLHAIRRHGPDALLKIDLSPTRKPRLAGSTRRQGDERKNLIYRRSSGVWDSGLAPPKSAGSPVGLDVDPDTGDILIAGTNTNRIYRYSGGSWDSGILIPH